MVWPSGFSLSSNSSCCPLNIYSRKDLEFPKRHELYNDFLIVPSDAFLSSAWQRELEDDEKTLLFFEWLSGLCKVRIIARKARITVGDDMRRPQLTFLYLDPSLREDPLKDKCNIFSGFPSDHLKDPNHPIGKHFWVSAVQFGIKFSWNPAQIMFSAGNVSEKQRVYNTFKCQEETVVDLYAGIGYFTLPYLVGAKAKFVYACELNPDSLRALERNLKLNKISPNRFKLLLGDHHDHCLELAGKAQRVNMGFLPRCDASFALACNCIEKRTGGFIHVHENILETELNQRSQQIVETFRELYGGNVTCENIVRVKSYAPRVWHYVLDLALSPQLQFQE